MVMVDKMNGTLSSSIKQKRRNTVRVFIRELLKKKLQNGNFLTYVIIFVGRSRGNNTTCQIPSMRLPFLC